MEGAAAAERSAAGERKAYRHVAGSGSADDSAWVAPPAQGDAVAMMFWRVQLLRRCARSGVHVSETVFVHGDVWKQDGAKVTGLPAKAAAIASVVKAAQGLRVWISPSMSTLRQLVQSPETLRKQVAQFHTAVSSVAKGIRSQFALELSRHGGAHSTAATGASSATRRRSSSAASTEGAGAGAGVGAGAGSQQAASSDGTPSRGRVTSVGSADGILKPPPVPPRSVSSSTARDAGPLAPPPLPRRSRSSFSASVSRFGGAFLSMVTKGAATAIGKISHTITTVRLKSEDLQRFAVLVSHLGDALAPVEAWMKAGADVGEPRATVTDAASLFTYPSDMHEAEQAAWTGLVRSICREDAALRSTIAAACLDLDATLLQLLVLDMGQLTRRYITHHVAGLLATRADTVRSSTLVANALVDVPATV